jgi:hypothetical protein
MAVGMEFRSAPNYHAAASRDIPGASHGNRSLTISAQIRTMLRAVLLTGLLASAGAAFAQEGATDGGDFLMRPTEPAPGVNLNLDDEAFWSLIGTEPAVDPAPMITGSIGPRMAGPRTEDPVGPPLAGPFREDVLPEPRPFPVDRELVENPFEPLGVRLGTFLLRPAVEIGVSATDNADGGEDKDGAIGLAVAPEIVIRSDWSRHQLDADFRGTGIFYGDEEIDEREAEARVEGRYDLSSTTALGASAYYQYDLDSYTDPDTPSAAVERPPVHSFGSELSATRTVSRIGFTVRGAIDRDIHEDVALDGGGTADRGELDNTRYSVALRTSYELAPTFTPFLEVVAGRRVFDDRFDSGGFERDSRWGELRGGLIVDMGPKISGEIAVGYRHEILEDDDLDDIDAVTVNAGILWSPRRLTEVRLNLATTVEPTSAADSSGSVIYAGTLSVSRQLQPRLRIEAGASVEAEHFIGIGRDDTTIGGFAAVSYALNRNAAIIARYDYEQIISDAPGADSEENIIGVRVRLQR